MCHFLADFLDADFLTEILPKIRNFENTLRLMLFLAKSNRTKNIVKMSLQVPKPKRNERMSIAHRKHFARMITNGADYKEINLEHNRLFKKPMSRSTYQRIKSQSGVILTCETHRKKNKQYKMKHDDERRIFEEH